jgi:TPR repeat protein
MADIFISYAREDEATAQRLRDVLASQGWDVWRDKEGIATGSSWGTSIETALRDAKCVVVLWSPHALSSHFVRDEAEIGRNANKLVPVQIGDVELPIGFRGIQTANLMYWQGELDHPEYRKLVAAIGDRVGAGNVVAAVHPPADRGAWLRRAGAAAKMLVARPKFPYYAGGAAVAILALWALSRLWSGGDPHDALEQGLKNYFDQRYVEAESQLHSAAQHGSGLASFYLAAMYFNGNGVKQDDVKALDWAFRGAKLGDARAQNYVGYLLGNGRGTKKDHDQALRWYLAAADQGLGTAAYNAGLSYANGEGTRADPQKAVEYYRRAYDLGDALGANALGDMYRFGRGVGLDLTRAAQWYKLAADRGDAVASTNLGYLYATGQGVTADDYRAAALYRHAADLNNASGINNLGYMYENGRGVPVDLTMAMALYKRAADLGERSAVSNLGRIQERMRYQQPQRR